MDGVNAIGFRSVKSFIGVELHYMNRFKLNTDYFESR